MYREIEAVYCSRLNLKILLLKSIGLVLLDLICLYTSSSSRSIYTMFSFYKVKLTCHSLSNYTFFIYLFYIMLFMLINLIYSSSTFYYKSNRVKFIL